MKFQIRKLKAEGEIIPRGYGIAYRDFASYISVCYPVPLNWIVRAGREVARFLKLPPMTEGEQDIAKAVQIGFDRGYDRGKSAGYSQAVRMIDERIRTIVDNKLIEKVLGEKLQ